MDLFEIFSGRVRTALERLQAEGRLPPGLSLERVVVESPRDPSHGELSTNAAMVLAKEVGRPPRVLGEEIAEALRGLEDVTAVEVAGPGFLNLRLHPRAFEEVLRSALRFDGYGRGWVDERPPVNIEYVSANPTGPLHVGHGRGAVYGDALANLLDFAGRAVVREYYVNDAGAQVDVLARSAFHRYREALSETTEAIPEGLYPGDYLVPVGASLAERYGRALLDQAEADWLPLVRDAAVAAMMELIRADLAALGIRHDIFFSERSLQDGRDAVAETIENFRARDLIYEGRLPPPKGAPVDDYEDREQTLFRATRYGDDVDRPLMKSDGSYTYFASDIAYHRSKHERGHEEMIDVWGADHGGYVKRMKAAVAAVTEGRGELDVKLCQLVKLVRDGEPVKMSKRAGDFVTLREVVDEVGVDAVRFMLAFRKNDAPLAFDLALVKEQSKDNPVFYVQYAHARCASARRQAAEAFADLALDEGALASAPLERLTDEGERALLAQVAQFPRLVSAAAAAHEPHRVAFFAHELAGAFHAHWNRGKDLPELRFVKADDRRLTLARMALVAGVRTVLRSALGILGVSAPDEMR